MNNTISVYELLGLIKDEKAPKKIKVLYDFYEYDKYNEFYYNEDGYSLYRSFYEEGNALDIEVEILEEDKPIIEKIEIKKYNFHNDNHSKLLKNQEQLSNKLNELIDYLNRKESK